MELLVGAVQETEPVQALGSGITLDAMVRHAADVGHEQRVVVAVPDHDPHPEVGGLAGDQIHSLVFGDRPLDFAVPGMSDVMPYPSTRFSELTDGQLNIYRREWSDHLRPIVDDFKPDIIHSHHVWLMSGLLKDVAPDIPIVTQCHATGMRQMELCPHLIDEVRRGCSRIDAFAVLHRGHAEALRRCLGITDDRIHRSAPATETICSMPRHRSRIRRSSTSASTARPKGCRG